jgi:hypothetical protein
MRDVVISATVVTSDQEAAVRTIEAFARAATGLALDGMNVSVSIFGAADEAHEIGGNP